MRAGTSRSIGIVASQSRRRARFRLPGLDTDRFADARGAGLDWTNGDWVLYRKARSLGPRRTALHGLARRPVVGNEADGARRRDVVGIRQPVWLPGRQEVTWLSVHPHHCGVGWSYRSVGTL